MLYSELVSRKWPVEDFKVLDISNYDKDNCVITFPPLEGEVLTKFTPTEADEILKSEWLFFAVARDVKESGYNVSIERIKTEDLIIQKKIMNNPDYIIPDENKNITSSNNNSNIVYVQPKKRVEKNCSCKTFRHLFVVYVNMRDISIKDRDQYIVEIKKNIEHIDYCDFIYIPTFDRKTRIKRLV